MCIISGTHWRHDDNVNVNLKSKISCIFFLFAFHTPFNLHMLYFLMILSSSSSVASICAHQQQKLHQSFVVGYWCCRGVIIIIVVAGAAVVLSTNWCDVMCSVHCPSMLLFQPHHGKYFIQVICQLFYTR